MANLIARTQQIKFGTGVICLPQYHPAVIAGYAAMFDHLSEGRFIMGVGPGGLPPDFELFGIMDADRNQMMIESLVPVLATYIMAGGSTRHAGTLPVVQDHSVLYGKTGLYKNQITIFLS